MSQTTYHQFIKKNESHLESQQQNIYHHGVDNDVVCEVWQSYLREWTKISNGDNDKQDDNDDNDDGHKLINLVIPKPAQLLAVSHGVPSSLRSEIWFIISGGQILMNKYSNNGKKNYKYLSTQEQDNKYLNQINKDFERTFVTKDLPIVRKKIQHQLRRMLIAYSNYNKYLGYAQGMNMIAAFVLRQFLNHDEFFNTNFDNSNSTGYTSCSSCSSSTSCSSSSSFVINANIADNSMTYNSYSRKSHSSLVLECDNDEELIEEKAFWCFVQIMTNIETLFQKKLIGYHESVKCLINILKINDFELYEYFDNLGIDTLFTGVFIKWFTSLFAYPSFNLQITQKLWDIWILYQFDFAIFIKFAFLIFQNNKSNILTMDDIDIPQFMISSKCSVSDQNWMLKLTKLKMKPLNLSKNAFVINTKSNINDDDDDDKQDDNNNKLIEISSIYITSTRSEANKSYGEYCINIKCIDNKEWSLWKRYSDFDELNNKLILLGIEPESNYTFPSKSWLYKSNDESLMSSRKIILNEYIKNVLNKYNKNRQNDDTLIAFHDFIHYFANHSM